MLESFHPNWLSFIAAIFVAVSNIMYRLALNRLSPAITTLALNLSATMLACSLYALGDGVRHWPWSALLWFVLVGVCGSLAGRYLSLVGVNLIGLARSQVLAQSVLVWSSLQGVLLLGERMTIGIAIGTVAIMCGAILLVYDRRADVKPAPLRYYLVPLVASFLFSLTFIFRKYGLALLPSAPLGIAVSTGSAAFLLIAAMPLTGERGVKRWDPRGLLTVFLGAMANIIAAVFFWTSIQRGNVVQVIPVNRLSVLMVICLSWLFLKRQEVVTWRILAGGVLSVAGAFAVVWGK